MPRRKRPYLIERMAIWKVGQPTEAISAKSLSAVSIVTP